MGAVEELQEKHSSTRTAGPALSATQPRDESGFEAQLRWQALQSGYIQKLHSDWWNQMPLGNTMSKLSQFTLSKRCLLEHLEQLFRIDKIESKDHFEPYLSDLCLRAFEGWEEFVQHLGLMMLSVPLSVEIDGRVKKPFVESFGPFGVPLQRYAEVDEFKAFYKGSTFRHLRVLNEEPQFLLKEASFKAWAMVSLVLPKGVTQRVHLTLDPLWVAQIQELRSQFDHPEVIEYIIGILPDISRHLASR